MARLDPQTRQKIASFSGSGRTAKDVAGTFNITPGRVRQIWKEQKVRQERQSAGLLCGHLDVRTVNTLKRILGVNSPTLADLQKWIHENEDWRYKVLRTREAGRKTLAAIEVFAMVEGLLPPPEKR